MTQVSALRIWDPFFCTGRCTLHLRSLGFKSVYNRNEDFYAVAGIAQPGQSQLGSSRKSGKVTTPPYDILVTNPPYSADHKERVLAYCAETQKPWLLLMPNYVATKSYFRDIEIGDRHEDPGVFFVVPCDKYEYDHPMGTGWVERGDPYSMKLKSCNDRTTLRPVA